MLPPSAELIKNANATSSWYEDAEKDPLEFWQKQALTRKIGRAHV